eukprot:scaffold1449_cov108-Isochrysis_galbana.AAC.9
MLQTHGPLSSRGASRSVLLPPPLRRHAPLFATAPLLTMPGYGSSASAAMEKAKSSALTAPSPDATPAAGCAAHTCRFVNFVNRRI